MKLNKLLASLVGILVLSVIASNSSWADRSLTYNYVCHTVYADGKPAQDAVLTTYTIDNLTRFVTTDISAADDNGNITRAVSQTPVTNSKVVQILASSSGIGFSPPQEADDQRIILYPFASVRIHLVDSTGQPIPNVRICPKLLYRNWTFCAWDQDIQCDWNKTTDASGNATLTHLPQGYSLRISVLDDRFADTNFGADIPLANSSATTYAIVRTMPAATIAGTIRYAKTNKPAAGIYIAASTQYPDRWSRPVLTDSRGCFTVPRLSHDIYGVYVCPNQPGLSEWVSIQEPVDLATGEQKTGVDLNLQHGGLIQGVVTDKLKAIPIPNLIIFANGAQIHFGQPPFTMATTDANGKYQMRILPGNIYVQPNGSSFNANGRIQVDEGATKTLDFQTDAPTPFRYFSGTVLGPNGQPAASVRVTANSNVYYLQHSTTDSRGGFVFDSPGLDDNASLTAQSNSLSTAAPIAIHGRSSVTLHLVAGLLSTINGTVIDQKGTPLPYAKIQINPSPPKNYHGSYIVSARVPELYEAMTDATGHYSVTAPDPGKYNISADLPGYSFNAAYDVQALRGQAAHAPDIVLTANDSYAGGVVLDTNGKPIAGIDVVCDTARDYFNGYISVKTDKSGRFLIGGISRGKSELYAVSMDYKTQYGEIVSNRMNNVIRVEKPDAR